MMVKDVLLKVLQEETLGHPAVQSHAILEEWEVTYGNYEDTYDDGARNYRSQGSPSFLDVVEHASRRGPHLTMKVTFHLDVGHVESYPMVLQEAREMKFRKSELERKIKAKEQELEALTRERESMEGEAGR